jgi:hypothetical protein
MGEGLAAIIGVVDLAFLRIARAAGDHRREASRAGQVLQLCPAGGPDTIRRWKTANPFRYPAIC